MGLLVADRCSLCAKPKVKGRVFYIVRLTLTADFDGQLEDIREEDLDSELKRTLKEAAEMDEQELMNEVFQEFCFYLCKSCRDRFVKNPLGASKSQGDKNG